MRKIYLWGLLLLSGLGFLGCQNKAGKQYALRQHISDRFDNTQGAFALAFVDVADTSQSLLINDREMFHAASTMKTPVMIEIFKQVAQGKFSLSDSIKVKNQFRSIVDSSAYKMDLGDDSNEQMYQHIGHNMTIRDLIQAMITTSSNLATNILVEKVGAHNVTQTMRSYGADSIRVLRGVEDIKAFDRGLNNKTNARDLMIIFEKLARGQAVSPEASRQMIDILKQQEFNTMIPARLPDSVQVAHKTGSITGVHHDSGLVILPDGRQYVLVMLSKDVPVKDKAKVTAMFADISKDIYDYVTAEKP